MSAFPVELSAKREADARAVIDKVADGAPLKAALAELGLSPGAFHHVVSGHRELGPAYARAQEIRADILVEEAIEAADTDSDAARARNRMTIRQWAASKYNSKRYGERIDLNIQQSISINDALSEARLRILRPVRDQLDVEDAQVIDSPRLSAPEPTDNKSVSGDAPGATSNFPDIFS